MFTLQVFGSTWLLARRFEPSAVFVYVSLSMLALVAVTARRDYYYAYLGEAPQLGFTLLGCALLATGQEKLRSGLLGGICFSLAILTKQAAVFSVLGASAVWCVTQFWRQRWQVRRLIAAFSTGLAGPILAFEAVKVGALGWAGYRGTSTSS